MITAQWPVAVRPAGAGGARRAKDPDPRVVAAETASRLRIGGFTPLTTIDYPGELAAIVFCQGCPWRCHYCHNGHLLPARSDRQIPWSDVRAFLAKRRGLLDAVVFSGGEPTLQSALSMAMAEVKTTGYKVGLHTAGPFPERLRRLLPYLDWVGLDIKAMPMEYPSITGVEDSGHLAWESLRLLLESGIPLQVRTTLVSGQAASDRIGRLKDKLVTMGVRHHAVQDCRPTASPTAP
jgi:pyruvate formate lyase activating enzyme